MGLFDRNQPELIKEGGSATEQLAALEALRGHLTPAGERQLQSDIRAVRAGIAGEERVLFELMNSHMDLFVLQDLFLEHDGLTAQIDFLVLTPQRNFVIECKNLYGDIGINARGDFTRTFGSRKREGIYSPITQNQRHIDLIHAMLRDNRSTLMNLLLDRDFDDLYRGLVVLANPKTVLDDRYAKKDVKSKIVRADQLVATIKAINAERGLGREKTLRSKVKESAQWFASQHRENPTDYTAKYDALCKDATREKPGHKTPEAPEAPEAPEEKTSAEKASVEKAPQAACAPVPPAPSSPASSAATDDSSAPEAGAAACTPSAASVEDAPVVTCPRCGAPMVLRTAKRGARAGKQFYGCSTYPHCRGIVNLEE